jgi:hypothetical protein
MKPLNTPAIPKKEYVPHDCKQYDLPPGTQESLDIWNIQALQPSTKFGDEPYFLFGIVSQQYDKLSFKFISFLLR